jgi:hypothetical protein
MRSFVRGSGLLALAVLLLLTLASLFAPSHTLVFGGSPLSSHQMTVVAFPSASSVIGRPSLSVAFVNKVLAAYGSPAAGTGQALYDLGVHYGIDDVYALAFFLHEDTFGKTGWGAVNHSLGNSRCGGWSSCQGGYRFYPTWEAGYQDWYQLILYGYVRGEVTIPLVGHRCSTIEQIVPVYAPSSDGNDVRAYIVAVLQAVATWHAGRVWV